MKQFWKEFRDFIARGNLVEIAVAFVMGAAFGAVVNSFIFDIVMPPIGKLVGNVDFSNLFVVLGPEKYPSAEAARAAGAPAIYYGRFINNLVNFLIIASRHVPPFAGGHADAETEGSPCSHHEGMPLLQDPNPHRSSPLPQLHFSARLVLAQKQNGLAVVGAGEDHEGVGCILGG
jgi:large conductance mechanosensitive channel protein